MRPVYCTCARVILSLCMVSTLGVLRASVTAVNTSSRCRPELIHEGLARFAHPTLCTHYMECDVARTLHIRHCPDGLFYDPHLMTCVFPYDINCPNDVCFLFPNRRAYSLPGDSCNKYFVCKYGWTYERQCCGGELAFDGVRGCQLDASCKSICNDSVTRVGVQPGDCNNLPDPNDKTQFRMLDNKHTVTMKCAAGAFYDVTTCECSIIDLVYILRMNNTVCTPTVSLNFRGGTISSFEDKSGQKTYIENKHVLLSSVRSASGNGRSANFSGLSHQSILLPRFTFSEFFPKLKINVVFKLNSDPAVDPHISEALVTNSDMYACDDVRPSVSLSLERASKTVTAVVLTTMPHEITVSNSNLIMNGWNDLSFTFDGESVTLILNSLPSKSHPTGNPAKIVPVQCALHIGSGTSLQTLNGLIDTFELLLC